MEVFHIRKYVRFSLSEICHFVKKWVVPGTDPWVPGNGDLEHSLNGDPEVRVLPGVRRKIIPEYFSPTETSLFLFLALQRGVIRMNIRARDIL